jgi:hypothetical protein
MEHCVKAVFEPFIVTDAATEVPDISTTSSLDHVVERTEPSITDAESNSLFDELLAVIMILPETTEFAYRWTSNPRDAEIDIVCESPMQHMQLKYAAWRICKGLPTDGSQNPNDVDLSFGPLKGSGDASNRSIKVIFDLATNRPADFSNADLFRILGVPEPPDYLEIPESYVFDKIEEVTTPNIRSTDWFSNRVCENRLEGVQKSDILARICSALFEDFGQLALPPLTLNEFGNVLFALDNYGDEVGLAMLRYVCSQASRHD